MTDMDQAPAAPGDPKVIKRYTNRKLYDTVESRYVTLEEIAEMVKGGADVKIVDNRTKEDLTSVTMAQIIFEEEKKTSKMPLAMLRDLIRARGATVQQFIQKELSPRVQSFREEAESLPKELVALSAKTVEDWQRRVDERIKAVVEGMTSLPALAKDLHELARKLDELEKKIAELEKDQ